MKKTKLSSRLAACMLALILFVSGTPVAMAESGNDNAGAGEMIESGITEIYFTNDVHCAYKNYSKVASIVDPEDFLIDAGDNIQGDVIGTISDGAYMVDIMNKMDYDAAVPGNHEFDYGMERFFEVAGSDGEADFPYLSANFRDLRTGENVLDSYMIFDVDGTKVAVVGVSTPETVSKSNPATFKNARGEWIYDFCDGNDGKDLYDSVQKAVDAAEAEGAEIVIAAGHLGMDSASKPWTAEDLIKNTAGIDVFIDGHSHNAYETDLKNKDGETVKAVQTGTKLEYIGKLNITDGEVDTELIEVAALETDPEMEAYLAAITEEVDKTTAQVVGKTEVELVVNDPETDERIIRHKETNLGDFVADAYRYVLGTDVAFCNGGGIRASLEPGEITLADLISVHPYGNMMCALEVKGSDLLDAIELCCMELPEENGSFLHVSGITYTVNTAIPSSVKVNEKGEFVSIDGPYRVSDVKIGGEPLDPDRLYSLGSHDYMLLDLGSGMTMFKDAKVLMQEVALDNQVLIDYLTDGLGGVIKADSIYADPYGAGRINIIDEPVEKTFTDVAAEDWFYEGVEYAVEAGYMNGTSETEFSPQADTTRGMLMTILARMAGVDTTESTPWYQTGLEWAVENEISDGTFPEAAMTREQLVTMLYRNSGFAEPGPDITVGQVDPSKNAGADTDEPSDEYLENTFVTLDDFVDADSVSSWAKDAMAWAVECGIITGIADAEGNLSLNPQGMTLRCQLAVMLQRYDALMEI